LQTLRYRMSNKRKRCAYVNPYDSASSSSPQLQYSLGHHLPLLCTQLQSVAQAYAQTLPSRLCRSAKQVSKAGQHSRSAQQVSTAGQQSRSAQQVSKAGQHSRSAQQVSKAGQQSRSAQQVSKAGQHSRSAKQVISSVLWCCSPVSCCRRGPSSDPSLAMDRAIRGSPPSSMCHPVAITGSTYLHGHDW